MNFCKSTHSDRQKNSPYFIVVLCISLLLMSCSMTGGSYQLNKNISDYAETLFKRQNNLTQQVMMSFDADLSRMNEDEISNAELMMHDACHLLNTYATLEIEGKNASIFFRRKLKNSLQRCEQRVNKLQLILTEIDIGSE